MTSENVDELIELLEHLVENHLRPEIVAQAMRDAGLPVRVAEVSTDPQAEGFTVTCIVCSRTAKLPFVPPDAGKALCPRCLPGSTR